MWPPTAEKYDIQRLKSQIADADFTIFSLGPKAQRSTKCDLWYRQHPKDKALHCQINIVVPGIQDLPAISADRISIVDGLPLIPVSIALFHLLVQWDKTPSGKREHHYESGIRNLLASSHMDGLHIQRPWRELGLFTLETQETLTRTVQHFCDTFPDVAASFHHLGLPVNHNCESAARVVISAMKELGVVAAIRGSLACRLYSDSARNPRVRDDISDRCAMCY